MEDTGRSHRSYYRRMKRYLYDFWNVVDLLSYSLLIAAMCVRHFRPSETFTVARRMFFSFFAGDVFEVLGSFPYPQKNGTHSYNDQRDGKYIFCRDHGMPLTLFSFQSLLIIHTC